MKFTKTLAFLFLIFVFVGCASTESTSIAPESTTKNEPEEPVDGQVKAEAEDRSQRTGTLIESYISGEIPGYEK